MCDLDGVKHSVEVTASTLYEAVALGLAAIREQDWKGEIAEGLNTVDVSANMRSANPARSFVPV